LGAVGEFVLKDTFSEEVPRGLLGYDGCYFRVALQGSELSANVDVYDIQPHQWSAYFSDLSLNWRGWDGLKRAGLA
jgi:hypothetical protein